MFALMVGITVTLIGFFVALIMPAIVLIMRMVRNLQPKHAAAPSRQSDMAAIDVETIVLPPERDDPVIHSSKLAEQSDSKAGS